jgi:hypothetical protein
MSHRAIQMIQPVRLADDLQGPEEAGGLLPRQAPRADQPFDLPAGGVEQVIPPGEPGFQGREGFLVRLHRRLAGQDDVDQFVGRVLLVSEVRGAVQGRENSGNLTEVTDAGVDPLKKLLAIRRGVREQILAVRNVVGQSLPPGRDIRREDANPVEKIASFGRVRRPPTPVRLDGAGVRVGGVRR